MEQGKQESDDIHNDLDRIANLFFGEDDENIVECGIIYEGDFHRDMIEHENKDDISSKDIAKQQNAKVPGHQ